MIRYDLYTYVLGAVRATIIGPEYLHCMRGVIREVENTDPSCV